MSDFMSNPSVIQIPLTQGKFTFISPQDADLAGMRWCAIKNKNLFYCLRAMQGHQGTKNMRMHRLIMQRMLGRELERREFVDHINGNGLDNRRENLRLATNSQNLANKGAPISNTSGIKGVSRHGKKWQAKIKGDGRQIHLGLFVDILDAARAYNEAALKYHGEFARLNTIEEK